MRFKTNLEDSLARCTDLWQQVVNRRLRIIPTFGGGTATGWNYWVSGKGTALPEDFGQMISPKLFKEMILIHDMHLVNGRDCVWYHVHSGALHMARAITECGAFGAVQITNDYPAGPSIEDMLPTLQYIQERACLILRKFSLDQLERVIGHLSLRGLAIDIQCYDRAAGDDIQTMLMTQQEHSI